MASFIREWPLSRTHLLLTITRSLHKPLIRQISLSTPQFSPPKSPPYAMQEIDEEDYAYYRPQGFHPVAIGDKFNNGRYEVTRKLGFGAYSTAWLCRDHE
jgi:hypothetical protein